MPRKKRINEALLKKFYRLLSVRMLDFDCGTLCAPENGGIPKCCENDNVVPVLFHEEYHWHRERGKFWKRASKRNPEVKKFIDESETYYVFANCPGPSGCRRSMRSFNCRIYPFEPYVNRQGDVEGLMYAEGDKDTCPLIGRPARLYNPKYIANSIRFWSELFEIYPEEKEMYIRESRKRRRRTERKGKRFKVIRPVL
jgi:hypothetical protein